MRTYELRTEVKAKSYLYGDEGDEDLQEHTKRWLAIGTCEAYSDLHAVEIFSVMFPLHNVKFGIECERFRVNAIKMFPRQTKGNMFEFREDIEGITLAVPDFDSSTGPYPADYSIDLETAARLHAELGALLAHTTKSPALTPGEHPGESDTHTPR